MRTLGGLLAVLALVVAQPAAALMIQVSTEELVASSDAVVKGKVTKLESRFRDVATRFIVTDVTIAVDDVWAGAVVPGRSLVFTIVGGMVGELGMKQSDQPEFTRGEEVLLFLRDVPRAGYEVNFLEQGKFTIANGKAWNHHGTPMSLTALRLTVNQFKRTR